MARHAGQPQISFSDAFFEWFDHQEMVLAKYPYAGMDFRVDPDLVLLAGEQWGVIGKCSDHIAVYCFYNVLMSFNAININQTHIFMQILDPCDQQCARG